MSASADIPRLGDELPKLVVEPTTLQLFAFSAATWNSHRIHVDADYARDVEGYPNVLVQSQLFACFLTRTIRAAYGPKPRLLALGWQNRGIAVPGDRLEVTGEVSAVAEGPGGIEAELTLQEHNQRGELCIKGWATLAFSRSGT